MLLGDLVCSFLSCNLFAFLGFQNNTVWQNDSEKAPLLFLWIAYLLMDRLWPQFILLLKSVSLVSLTYPHHCEVVNTSSLSGTVRCSTPILYISVPVLESAISPKEPWVLLVENGIRRQDLSTRYAHFYGASLLLSPLSWQSDELNVYILTSV